MPIDPDSSREVTAYDWVPPAARGQVRDLRVRWALEEAGLSYRTRLISVRQRPDDYYRDQPFGQVPFYRDGTVEMFECGAIALHIAEQSEVLLPRGEAERAKAISWLFAALNSIDPMVMMLMIVRMMGKGQDWTPGCTDTVAPLLQRRLDLLATRLGSADWLEGNFTVGDLMMVATLRTLSSGVVTMPDPLTAYIARGEARPAFQAALAAQLGDFLPDQEGVSA
jgi:glutathione S-transferase